MHAYANQPPRPRHRWPGVRVGRGRNDQRLTGIRRLSPAGTVNLPIGGRGRDRQSSWRSLLDAGINQMTVACFERLRITLIVGAAVQRVSRQAR